MYDVANSLPVEAVTELNPGTSVLITGPPMVGKRELALELVSAGHTNGDGMLFIMTSESAAVVIEDLARRHSPLDRDQIAVIDCMGHKDQQDITDAMTTSLSAPDDLTGISAGTAKSLRQFSNRGVSNVRHGFVSVSTLLQYLEPDTVFKFLHIYTQRIADTQGLGIFTIDHTAHAPQVVTTIVSQFDRVIELRESDSGDRTAHFREPVNIPSQTRFEKER